MSLVSRRTGWIALLALLAVFAGRVYSTFTVFNDTRDEQFHIEAGLDYLQRGVYTYEPQHPPLARVAVGVLPFYVGGLRLTEDRMQSSGAAVQKPLGQPRGPGESFLWAGMWKSGSTADYWRTLTLARVGSLVFGLLAILIVFFWSRELYGAEAAVASAVVAAFSPTLLAHSGLATLDAGAAATGVAAACAIWRWTRQPTMQRAAVAGAVLAIAVCTKFSNLPFLAPVVVAYLFIYRRDLSASLTTSRNTSRQGIVAVLVGLLVVMAVYRFDFGGMAPKGSHYISDVMMNRDGFAVQISRFLGSTPLPAPALVQGLIDVVAHNDSGHAAYLLGEWSDRGRVFYFPIALAVKTTLPLLFLVMWAVGSVIRARKGWLDLAAPLVPLISAVAIAMASDINIGIRHILIAYPLMAVAVGGLFQKFSFRRSAPGLRNGLLALLLSWHVGASAWAHPNHLAYFNELAGDSPQRILLDSNLDWGQDVARLGVWVEENGSPCVIARLFAATRPDKFGICTQVLPATHPDAGLLAMSVNYLLGMEGSTPQLRALAATQPLAVVGDSIYIYRIDPRQLPALAPRWFFENYEAVGEPAR
jgi:hypothetical protein